MRILKRSLPERIWRRLGRHPMLVMSTATLGIKVAQEGIRLRSGEIDGPEFRLRTGGHVGSMSGGLAGAAAGAAWGSALPGFGTVVGAIAGGFIGEELGGRVGRLAVEQTELSVHDQQAKRAMSRRPTTSGRSDFDGPTTGGRPTEHGRPGSAGPGAPDPDGSEQPSPRPRRKQL